MSRAKRLYEWADDRLDLEESSSYLGKAFPAEDSFLLGEVALFSFGMLVLTGIFLGFFYEPSMTKTTYEGSVAHFQGEELPAAFTSVLQITYDVPFGMFIRRFHHWAAHLFVASIGLHMLRVFFTGAYRNPREPNWVVGTGLAVLAMGAAYTGYALPFDQFAATATSIGYNMASSVPLVGGVLAKVVFGGEFPSSATIPRLYFLHVLVIPLLLAGGIGLHMLILLRQKHTEAQRDEDVEAVPGGTAADVPAADEPAPSASDDAPAGAEGTAADGGVVSAVRSVVDRDDDSVVVGLPAFPNQAAVSAVVFFLVLATLSLLAGFLPVHNVAEYGPYNPASTPAVIMPDWFLMWVFGFLKIWPSWLTFHVGPLHFSSEFLGGIVLPGLVFAVVFAWPFIDRTEEGVHFTADPLDRAWQTAAGVAGVVFVMIASIAGMNVLLADAVGVPTSALTNPLRIALLGGPVLAFGLVYWMLKDHEGDGEEASPTDGDAADSEEVAADD